MKLTFNTACSEESTTSQASATANPPAAALPRRAANVSTPGGQSTAWTTSSIALMLRHDSSAGSWAPSMTFKAMPFEKYPWPPIRTRAEMLSCASAQLIAEWRRSDCEVDVAPLLDRPDGSILKNEMERNARPELTRTRNEQKQSSSRHPTPPSQPRSADTSLHACAKPLPPPHQSSHQ